MRFFILLTILASLVFYNGMEAYRKQSRNNVKSQKEAVQIHSEQKPGCAPEKNTVTATVSPFTESQPTPEIKEESASVEFSAVKPQIQQPVKIEKKLSVKDFNNLDDFRDVIASKGKLDGKSSSDAQNLDAVVKVDSLKDFPDSIAPGQKVVCSLGLFKKDYMIKMIFNRKTKKRAYAPWSTSEKPNFIHVRFNNRLIYSRWTRHNTEIVSCLLSREEINSVTDYITVHNESEEFLYLDSAFIQESSNKDRCVMPVGKAAWLGPEHAQQIKTHWMYIAGLRDESNNLLNSATLSGNKFWEVKLSDDQDQYEIELIIREMQAIVKRKGRVSITLVRPESLWAVRSLKELVDSVVVNGEYDEGYFQAFKKEFPEIPLHFKKTFVEYRNPFFDKYSEILTKRLKLKRRDVPLVAYDYSGSFNVDTQKDLVWNFAYNSISAFYAGARNISVQDVSLGSAYFPQDSTTPSKLFKNQSLLTTLFDRAHHIPHNIYTYDAGFGLLDTVSFSFKDQHGIINLLIAAKYDINRNVSFEVSGDDLVEYDTSVEAYTLNKNNFDLQQTSFRCERSGNNFKGSIKLKNLNIIRLIPKNYKAPKLYFAQKKISHKRQAGISRRITNRDILGPSLLNDTFFEIMHGKSENVNLSKIPASYINSWRGLEGKTPFKSDSHLIDFTSEGHLKIPMEHYRFGTPEKIHIWLRPTENVNISIGVNQVCQKVNLNKDRWNCIEVDYKKALNGIGYAPLEISAESSCTLELNDIIGIYRYDSEYFSLGQSIVKGNQIMVVTVPSAKHVLAVVRLDRGKNFKIVNPHDTFKSKFNETSGILYLTFKNHELEKKSDALNAFVFNLVEEKK